jgi:hypothetical protein
MSKEQNFNSNLALLCSPYLFAQATDAEKGVILACNNMTYNKLSGIDTEIVETIENILESCRKRLKETKNTFDQGSFRSFR